MHGVLRAVMKAHDLQNHDDGVWKHKMVSKAVCCQKRCQLVHVYIAAIPAVESVLL